MSRITPIKIGQLILSPLKHFFKNYPPAPHFKWDPDAKKSKLDISMVNDAHKETFDWDMQILVDRGGFQVNKTGISDNLAYEDKDKGLYEKTNFLIYSGQAEVLVKARSEGNVEVLADMVMHVIQWSRPHICDTLGFKDFALPMTVSGTSLNKTNTEVFEVSISLPYMFEERWVAENDGLKLRQFFLDLSAH